MELAEIAAQLEELREQQKASKQAARDLEVKNKVAEVKSAAVKRSIEHNMKVKHHLEEIADLWVKPVERAVDGAVVTGDNVEVVNSILVKQTDLLKSIEDKINHELAMQYIGDTMPLGWDLVRHMESNPKIDPKLGIDGAEVRKQEKDMMTYQREMAAALKAQQAKKGNRGGGGSQRGVRASRGNREAPSTSGLRGEDSYSGGRGRGGRGGGSASKPFSGKCYKCGEEGHPQWKCPKAKKD